jgi:hypothetical protein
MAHSKAYMLNDVCVSYRKRKRLHHSTRHQRSLTLYLSPYSIWARVIYWNEPSESKTCPATISQRFQYLSMVTNETDSLTYAEEVAALCPMPLTDL